MAHPPSAARHDGLVGGLQRIGRELGGLLGHEYLPQMAAALAYRTIFSLVPLVLLGSLSLRIFGDADSLLKNLLTRLLEQTGLAAVATGEGNTFNLQVWIAERVKEFNGLNFTGIGLVSALLLVYAAISLLVELEGAFNRVYASNRARSWAARVLQYWLIVTLGPIMVAASFYAGDQFNRLARELAASSGAGDIGSWLVQAAGFIVPVVINLALLVTMYLTVPNTRVKFFAVLTGALVAATLFELAKAGFRLYLARNAYQSLYGFLALLPLFLLWVYVLWLVVLFGLRIAFLVQHKRARVLLAAWRGTTIGRVIVGGLAPSGTGTPPPAGPDWIDPTSLVSILAAVGRRFAAGRPASGSKVAEDLGMDESAVSRGLEHLANAGVIHEVGPGTSGDGYALSRPAERIALPDVLLLGYQLLGTIRPAAEPAMVIALREAQLAAAKGRTLADVIGALPGAKPPIGPSALGDAGPSPAPST